MRIGGVALSGCGKGSFLVGMVRQNLGRDGVTGASGAIGGLVGRIFCEGISGLNHEIIDDSVKEQAVVESFRSQFYKVVSVKRGVLVQHDSYGTLSRVYLE